ncbi:pyruvate dehydrogenase (acetyl-transferring) E1 component subunit alpha [Sulfolobales archaeon HS-7]|nr:pyruvate dehydrogenase (acetyl-transferring) E1 component subunit alpha [Sulfolobales archaeon HS-7]
MIEKIFQTEIMYQQVLDENGNIDEKLYPHDLSDDKLLKMYYYMTLSRAFDNKLISLQRQGRAVTYAPAMGEEAVQVGAASALRDKDYFVPNYRQHVIYFMRGLPIEKYMLSWRGFEEGLEIPPEVHGFPVVVPVGSQIPHAVGVAYALKLRNDGQVVLTFVGDGATSEGDFYEGMNFAGVLKVPLITIIENNQYAISTPRSKQTAAKTLAQKAVAAGIRAIQVDGNDVIGVYKAVKDAIDTIGEGPMLIEAITYRMAFHTTSDNPALYRTKEEEKEWKRRDPIDRMRKFLEKKGLWDSEKEKELWEKHQEALNKAVETADKFVPDPKSMFNVFSFLPETLKEEMEEYFGDGNEG